MGHLSHHSAFSLKIMAMKFTLTGVTDRKGKDWSSEVPNQYLEILMYPCEEWAVGSGKYFAKGKCVMDFTFGESEETFLAKQPNGIPFVLEPLVDAGSVVGYVLRYPEKSNTFEATFRAPESELQEPLKYAKSLSKTPDSVRAFEAEVHQEPASHLAAGCPLPRKPSARSLAIPGIIPGESPKFRTVEKRRSTAIMSTARCSADSMGLTPASRQGTGIESFMSSWDVNRVTDMQ